MTRGPSRQPRARLCATHHISRALLALGFLLMARPAWSRIDLSGSWVWTDASQPFDFAATFDHRGDTVHAEVTVLDGLPILSADGTFDQTTRTLHLEHAGACDPSGSVVSTVDAVATADGNVLDGSYHLAPVVFGGCFVVDGSVRLERSVATCGNGAIDPGEDCEPSDGSSCCSNACRFRAADWYCPSSGATCVVGACDGAGSCKEKPAPVGDYCSISTSEDCRIGMCDSAGACVATLAPEGFYCAGSGNSCTSGACSASGECVNTPLPAGSYCPGDESGCTSGACDGAGHCTLSPIAAHYLCSPPGGSGCEYGECDGNGHCEATPYPEGSYCPTSGNQCTVGACDGAGQCATQTLPEGSGCLPFIPQAPDDFSDFFCSSGSCDAEGTCVVQPVAAGTFCLSFDAPPCTVSSCDGKGHCTQSVAPRGSICRYGYDACDIAETCDGVSTDCPVDGHVVGPDSDGDGAPDSCDACTASHEFRGTVAVVGRIAGRSTPHELDLRTHVQLPVGSSFPDPLASPVNVRVATQSGFFSILSETLPPVSRGSRSSYGWRRVGRSWSFEDSFAETLGFGVSRLTLRRSTRFPNAVEVRTRLSFYDPLGLPIALPLSLTLDLDGTAPGGRCAEGVIGTPGGPAPRCVPHKDGAVFVCDEGVARHRSR